MIDFGIVNGFFNYFLFYFIFFYSLVIINRNQPDIFLTSTISGNLDIVMQSGSVWPCGELEQTRGGYINFS